MSSDSGKRTLRVKNLTQYTDKSIDNLFGSFGKTSHKIIASTENNKKDVIIEFESDELASKARSELDGHIVEGNKLSVDFAVHVQTSITSPSAKSNQKPKVSVLDRIIKLGDPKYPKGDEKGSAFEKLTTGKENPPSEHNSHPVVQTQKVIHHKSDKYEKSEYGTQLTVVKKGDLMNKTYETRGNYDFGSSYENHHTKRNFTTNNEEKITQRIITDGQRRLEIIKPKRDENNVQNYNSSYHKEYPLIKRNDSQSLHNSSNGQSDNKKSIEISSKEMKSDSVSKDNQYYSNKLQKKNDQSRSSSRSQSKSKDNDKTNANLPNYRPQSDTNSGSRSASRNRLEIQKNSNNNLNSQNKVPQIASDSNKDMHIEKSSSPKNRESVSHSKSSPSRSSQKRVYSPRKDYTDRRDDRNETGYDSCRKGGKSRSRSREKSKSRDNYYRPYQRSSRSRSNERRGYNSYNNDGMKNYGPRKMINGGLVIQKRDSAPQKDEDYDRDYYRGYRHDNYSRDRLQSNQRFDSRERPYQKDWKNSSDYQTRSPNSKKVMDNKRPEIRIEKRSDRMRAGKMAQEDREKSRNGENLKDVIHQKENTNMMANQMAAMANNPLYNNTIPYNLQSMYPNAYSNIPEPLQMPLNQNNDQYLPSYLTHLNKPTFIDPSSMVNPDAYVVSEPIHLMQTENIQSHHYETRPFENQENDFLPFAKMEEEVEAPQHEISVTENTNDTVKTEEKDSPYKKEAGSEQEIEEEVVADPLTNELQKNQKMQKVINYLIASGDYKKGLKEMLNAAEKLNSNK